LAGANLIYGLGMLEMGMTMSYPQLVMDADFAKMIKYTVPGIPVTDETMSLDAINDVGSAKDFLSHRNTFTFRKIQSQPELIDRRIRSRWLEDQGGLTLEERAALRARKILAEHRPAALPMAVLADLRRIVEGAEAERHT
jgi:trimethylamine--corrinoid protein Co-methyltransferase